MHACVFACGLAAMLLPVCACASGTAVRCWRSLHPVGWLKLAVQHGCMKWGKQPGIRAWASCSGSILCFSRRTNTYLGLQALCSQICGL